MVSRYKPLWREEVEVKRKAVLALEVAELVGMVGQEPGDGSEELQLVRKGSQVREECRTVVFIKSFRHIHW